MDIGCATLLIQAKLLFKQPARARCTGAANCASLHYSGWLSCMAFMTLCSRYWLQLNTQQGHMPVQSLQQIMQNRGYNIHMMCEQVQ
jgi:hypothetical protein